MNEFNREHHGVVVAFEIDLLLSPQPGFRCSLSHLRIADQCILIGGLQRGHCKIMCLVCTLQIELHFAVCKRILWTNEVWWCKQIYLYSLKTFSPSYNYYCFVADLKTIAVNDCKRESKRIFFLQISYQSIRNKIETFTLQNSK